MKNKTIEDYINYLETYNYSKKAKNKVLRDLYTELIKLQKNNPPKTPLEDVYLSYKINQKWKVIIGDEDNNEFLEYMLNQIDKIIKSNGDSNRKNRKIYTRKFYIFTRFITKRGKWNIYFGNTIIIKDTKTNKIIIEFTNNEWKTINKAVKRNLLFIKKYNKE